MRRRGGDQGRSDAGRRTSWPARDAGRPCRRPTGPGPTPDDAITGGRLSIAGKRAVVVGVDPDAGDQGAVDGEDLVELLWRGGGGAFRPPAPGGPRPHP